MECKYCPQHVGQKWYNELGKTVSLMLIMCRYIFGSGEVVVLDSLFCVAKGITELEAKGVHVASLVNNRRYWPKWVPGDLIDNHFEYKEVGDVGMI